MKRVILALFQIGIVAWAAVVVYQHDLKNPSEIAPWVAAFFLRGWLSKDVSDPIFGHETPLSWAKTQIKKLAPKRSQPQIRYDI